jgi:hypothetical protein
MMAAWAAKPPAHEVQVAERSLNVWELVWEASGSFAGLKLGSILVAGIVQLTWLMLRNFTQRVNAGQLGEMLRKLIEANNIERAIKLCQGNSNDGKNATMRLALVGLEARARGENARDAVRKAFPQCLDDARKGLAVVMAVGVLGFVESVVVFAEGLETELGKHFAGFGVVPAVLLLLVVVNGLRWGGAQRDLEVIADAVSR